MNTGVGSLLYFGVLFTLGYLIYRYARYSKWEQTNAGRAFMSMKVCLMALVVFAFWARTFPDHPWRDQARNFVVGGIWISLVYQVRVVLQRQGGFRRNHPAEHWVHDPPRND